jgi:hypothetical protein
MSATVAASATGPRTGPTRDAVTFRFNGMSVRSSRRRVVTGVPHLYDAENADLTASILTYGLLFVMFQLSAETRAVARIWIPHLQNVLLDSARRAAGTILQHSNVVSRPRAHVARPSPGLPRRIHDCYETSSLRQ